MSGFSSSVLAVLVSQQSGVMAITPPQPVRGHEALEVLPAVTRCVAIGRGSDMQ